MFNKECLRGDVMQIQVVRPGQTLYQLSQAYGVSIQSITDANELSPDKSLVVGQALVIPITGQYYWVESGDSLYTIANKFRISPQQLASVNGLAPNQPLNVGLRLYIPPRPRRNIEVNAYIEPRGDTVSPPLLQAARQAAPILLILLLLASASNAMAH